MDLKQPDRLALGMLLISIASRVRNWRREDIVYGSVPYDMIYFHRVTCSKCRVTWYASSNFYGKDNGERWTRCSWCNTVNYSTKTANTLEIGT